MVSTRVLYIHWDDWWKLCSQNWTTFANWDIIMLNISLSIFHIVLSLLLFLILITCIHHLCSNYYITIYIVIENIFDYDQNSLANKLWSNFRQYSQPLFFASCFCPFFVHQGGQKNGFCCHRWMVNTEFYSLIIQNTNWW